jgi:hypothetical protein
MTMCGAIRKVLRGPPNRGRTGHIRGEKGKKILGGKPLLRARLETDRNQLSIIIRDLHFRAQL